MKPLLCSCLPLLLAAAATTCAAENDKYPAGQPVQPRETVKLFNGKDFTGLYTWLKGSGYADPEGVFSVRDGMIRVSGEGAGYVATKQAYQNYHLTVEYKWGTHRSNKSKYVRNSGALLHATGPDGAAGGVWMSSLECQLAQGCEGDFILIRGKDADGKRADYSITAEIALGPDKRPRWKAGGEKTVYSGRQFWWNRHDHQFEELLDTRGRWDVASPLGEWTKVEALCRGDRVTIKINGKTVNECFAVRPAAGKILLQNEAYEVFFRRFDVGPLE